MAGNIKGLTVEINGETTGLEAALKDVGKRTNALNKELGLVEKGLKFDPSNTVLLGQKQQILAEKITNTRERLDALRQAQERVDAMFKAGEIDDGQYRAFQRDIAVTESKLGTFERQLHDVGQAEDTTGTKAKNLGEDFDKAGKKADGFEGKTGKLKQGLKNVAVAAATAAAAAVAAIGSIIGKVLDTADETQRLADTTGLSAEQIQELAYVGSNLGVDIETITGAQAKLTKSMNAARDGSGEQADAFASLGIAVTDSSGNLRDAKTVMGEAFDALNKVGNETERDALAQQIFGRSAADLNPLIAAGADELARLSDEANTNGAVMSNEAVAGLDEFGDTMENLKNGVMGRFGEWFAEVAPEIQGFIEQLANGGGIKSFIPPEIQEQLDTLKDALNNMLEVVMPTINVWYTKYIEPTMASVKEAFAAVAEDVIPTVTAIVNFVSENWPYIQQAIEPVMKNISGVISGVMTVIAGIIEAAMAVIRGDWDDAWGAVKKVWDGIVEMFQSSPIGQVIAKIADWFGTMVGRIKSAIITLKGYIYDYVIQPINGLIDAYNALPGTSDIAHVKWTISGNTGSTTADRNTSGVGSAGLLMDNGGMAYGPLTGYPATLHGREAVVPMQPKWLRALAAEIGQYSGTSNTYGETRIYLQASIASSMDVRTVAEELGLQLETVRRRKGN